MGGIPTRRTSEYEQPPLPQGTICCKIRSNLIKVAEDGAYSDEFLPYVKASFRFGLAC